MALLQGGRSDEQAPSTAQRVQHSRRDSMASSVASLSSMPPPPHARSHPVDTRPAPVAPQPHRPDNVADAAAEAPDAGTPASAHATQPAPDAAREAAGDQVPSCGPVGEAVEAGDVASSERDGGGSAEVQKSVRALTAPTLRQRLQIDEVC